MRYRVLIQVGPDPTSGKGSEAKWTDLHWMSETMLPRLLDKALDFVQDKGLKEKKHRMADGSLHLVEWEGQWDESVV